VDYLELIIRVRVGVTNRVFVGAIQLGKSRSIRLESVRVRSDGDGNGMDIVKVLIKDGQLLSFLILAIHSRCHLLFEFPL